MIPTPELDDRFSALVAQDPYRRSEFLLSQFLSACPHSVLEIEGRQYTVVGTRRIHPDTVHATDFVLRLDTQEGRVLFAKADVSEDFVYFPSTGEMTHVYGCRSRREHAMQTLQKRLALPYTPSTTIGEGRNIWFVSEEAPGPTVGEQAVLPLIESDITPYCRGLGRTLAFSYLFGLSDGHNRNSHYDGETFTQRDLETPFSDLMPIQRSLFAIARDGLFPVRLYADEQTYFFHLEDGASDSAWKKIIAQSLEDHLWPFAQPQANDIRVAIGEGFTTCYTAVQDDFAFFSRFVRSALNSWSFGEDPVMFLDMPETGLFRPTLSFFLEYVRLFSPRVLSVSNPWRIFHEIWYQASPHRVEAVRKSVLES